MGNTTTYVIGENEHGELGLGHQQKVHQLTKVKDQRPHNIYSGNKFTIFSDKYHQKMYVVGSDQWGETGTTCTALLNPTLITFFAEKRIKIKKVCVNTNARATFWIDDLGNVYGAGSNMNGQLGIRKSGSKNTVRKIPLLKEITDIQPAYNYSIALSQTNNDEIIMVINNWSKHCLSKLLPLDIINLLIIYYKVSNKIYATSYSAFGGNGHPRTQRNSYHMNMEWKEIKILMNKNIIKVETGIDHSLFLQDDGTIWCCGNNSVGELGIGHDQWIYKPMPIPYFVHNKIVIKQVCCGANHQLAVDDVKHMYSWGGNKFGQCGHGMVSQCINTPKLVEFCLQSKLNHIDCGSFHSYCGTDNGNHYLFGSNYDNECLNFNDSVTFVKKPLCVNDIVANYCNGKKIKAIYLG
eukprot:52848_1